MNTHVEEKIMHSLGKIEQFMEEHDRQEAAKQKALAEISTRVSDLESTREFFRGAVWWAGGGVTIGSAAWLLHKLDGVRHWLAK